MASNSSAQMHKQFRKVKTANCSKMPCNRSVLMLRDQELLTAFLKHGMLLQISDHFRSSSARLLLWGAPEAASRTIGRSSTKSSTGAWINRRSARCLSKNHSSDGKNSRGK